MMASRHSFVRLSQQSIIACSLSLFLCTKSILEISLSLENGTLIYSSRAQPVSQRRVHISDSRNLERLANAFYFGAGNLAALNQTPGDLADCVPGLWVPQ